MAAPGCLYLRVQSTVLDGIKSKQLYIEYQNRGSPAERGWSSTRQLD